LKQKYAYPTTRPAVPWNKRAFVGPMPPLKLKQSWPIRLNLPWEGRICDLELFDLAIDSNLLGDVVQFVAVPHGNDGDRRAVKLTDLRQNRPGMVVSQRRCEMRRIQLTGGADAIA